MEGEFSREEKWLDPQQSPSPRTSWLMTHGAISPLVCPLEVLLPQCVFTEQSRDQAEQALRAQGWHKGKEHRDEVVLALSLCPGCVPHHSTSLAPPLPGPGLNIWSHQRTHVGKTWSNCLLWAKSHPPACSCCWRTWPFLPCYPRGWMWKPTACSRDTTLGWSFLYKCPPGP